MTILIVNNNTGESCVVGSLDGHDMTQWTEVVGATIPADIATKSYDVLEEVFVVVPPDVITQAEFLALFTGWEQAMAANSTDAAMKTTLLILQAHQTIHLSDPRVADGLTLMVSLEIIDETRKAQVLAGIPPS